MTNHIHISLRNLSWLVILLTIGILAAGALTRASADSPGGASFNGISGHISVETGDAVQSGPPSQAPEKEDAIPIEVVDFDFANVSQELLQQVSEQLQAGDSAQDGNDTPNEPEQPAVPVPTEITGMSLTGSRPIVPVVPADGAEGDGNPDNADLIGEEKCECKQLTAWLAEPTVKVARRVVKRKTTDRYEVTVTIPYKWSLDCTNGEFEKEDKCSGNLKFSVQGEGFQYVLRGEFLGANPPHGEAIIEDGLARQKGEGPDIEVTCTGGEKCADSTDEGKFQYRLILNSTTKKITGKVLVTITTECQGQNEGKPISRTASIFVDSRLSGGVDEDLSDYDGDGRFHEFDHDDKDPNVKDDPKATVPNDK